MNVYNWYAGNQCYPKCSTEKVLKCRKKIQQIIEKSKIVTHKEFIDFIKNRYKICDLSPTEYVRNVYKEPLCHHANYMRFDKLNSQEKKTLQIIKELTLILIWLSKFSDQQINGDPIWRAWKGYDFKVLDSLLENEYISFSYKSKSVLLRDKGIDKAKELMKKYQLGI